MYERIQYFQENMAFSHIYISERLAALVLHSLYSSHDLVNLVDTRKSKKAEALKHKGNLKNKEDMIKLH